MLVPFGASQAGIESAVAGNILDTIVRTRTRLTFMSCRIPHRIARVVEHFEDRDTAIPARLNLPFVRIFTFESSFSQPPLRHEIGDRSPTTHDINAPPIH